jgi:hydrogenase maturation protease
MTILVIGIGNPDCGDDGVGRLVARTLRFRLPHGIRIEEADGESSSLLARLEGADCAYLIDACACDTAPGNLHRFDANRAPLPAARFGFSTHDMGLADALELARALGALPARCIVYAVEGTNFEAGTSLSPAVAQALHVVAERLCQEITDAVAQG